MPPSPFPLGSPFMQHLLHWLMPYFQAFQPEGQSLDPAEILATLNAYGATTRAEMLHAALALAFELSALDTLAQAQADNQMSATMRLRYRVCANALNRSALRNKAQLSKPRHCDAGQPQAELTDEQVNKALQDVETSIAASRNRLKPTAIRPGAAPHRRESTLSHLFATPSTAPPLAIRA